MSAPHDRRPPATHFVPLPVATHPSRRRIERARRMVMIVVACLVLWFAARALHPDGGDATVWRAVHLGAAAIAAIAVVRWAIGEVLYARRRDQARAQLRAWENHRTRPPRH